MEVIVIISATVCDSSCLKQESVRVLSALFGPLDTPYTCYCLYHTEELVTHLSPSSYPLSWSPLWRHSNILVLSEEVHREEQEEKSSVSATHVRSETLFSLFLSLAAPVSCLFIHSHPSRCSRWTLHIILRDAKQAHDEWWVQMGMFLVTAGVGAGAIARCGAREALACVTGRWGPCRTSRSAPIGCPLSRGCPTEDASETLSGRFREFLLAPGALERRREGVTLCEL